LAVGAEVSLEPGVHIKDVVDGAGGLAAFVVFDFEVAEFDLFVEAGSSAVGDGAGVIGEGAGQLEGGGFDGAGDQRAGQLDVVNGVVVTGPAQGLGGFAAVAVVAQAIEPAGGGN